MLITLDHTEDVAKNITTFWFEPEKPIDYIAGQFIQMTLPHDNPDERGEKHWFTLSSSPSEPLISITTKHAVGQVSTFKQTLFGLQPESQITISEAMGDFVLPKDVNIPLVFVAGGIGITPMRSMVKCVTDTGQKRNIHLIYGVRDTSELAFRELFENYGAKTEFVVSEPNDNWEGHTGKLSGELILELAGHSKEQLVYVSGPEPMTEALEQQLLSLGTNSDKLVLDFFPGYPSP